MATLFKNQILKPLSKFAKNLSPDKLKLSAIKGEGDLTNLELDEVALMELLDLPTWLLLNKVVCNKVSVKIQWTKLKSQPIIVHLDQVFVEIEALEEPRNATTGSAPSYRTNSGKYGMMDRVLDGVKISVNSVKIVFKAQAFKASVELSRLVVASKLPNWKDAELKFTSIRDSSRNAILLFKEIHWETTRIEADGLQDLQVTPVKLIANTSRIRITLKKRLSDCAILSSRLQLQLDDLLWVLTVSQLEAAVLFLKSLKSSIMKSSLQSKAKAEEKLKCQNIISVPNISQLQSNSAPRPTSAPQQAPSGKAAQVRRLFDYYDVRETSYHLYTGRVELHFCEEGQQGAGLSTNAVQNGAIRLVLVKINLDFFPFHPGYADRSHWPGYSDLSKSRQDWARRVHPPPPRSSPTDTPRALMESVCVLRITDIQMSCVSTMKQRKDFHFLASDKALLHLPPDTVTIFLDHTEFYHSDSSVEDIPPALFFCQLNPLHFRLDYETLVWLNAFYLNLSENLAELTELVVAASSTPNPPTAPPPPEMHVRMEATLPRIILPAEVDVSGQPERPTELQIQTSSFVFTSLLISSSFAEDKERLANALAIYKENNDFFINRPTNEVPFDWDTFHSRARFSPTFSQGPSSTSSLWSAHCSQVWMEFVDAKSHKLRPQTFLEPTELTLWLLLPSPTALSPPTAHILVETHLPLILRLNHMHLLFLYRISESFSRLSQHLSEDQEEVLSRISASSRPPPPPPTNLVIACRLSDFVITLVMPPLTDSNVSPHDNSTFFQFTKTVSPSLDRSVALGKSPNDRSPCVLIQENPPIFDQSQSCYPDHPLALSPCPNLSEPSLLHHNDIAPPDGRTTPNTLNHHSLSANQLAPSPIVYRGGVSPPSLASKKSSSGVFSGSLNQSMNKLGSTFTRFGGKLKATVASGASSTYGDDDSQDDWEHLSVTGSEFSESDEERLMALMSADMEAELGGAGISQGMPLLSAWTLDGGSRSHSRQGDEEDEIEMGMEASPERFQAQSIISRSKEAVSTVAFVLSGVNTCISMDAAKTLVTLVVLDCHVEESGRSCDDKTCNGGPSTDTSQLIQLTMHIPAVSDPLNPDQDLSLTQLHISRQLSLSLLMSSLVNMADLFEDEILPPPNQPFPVFHVFLHEQLCLQLVEDRACTNITCPGDHQNLILRLPSGIRLTRTPQGLLDLQSATLSFRCQDSSTQTPSYEIFVSAYQIPTHQTPIHQTPTHQPSTHQTPTHQPSTHQTPTHQPSTHQTPTHQPSTHQTPTLQPTIHQTPTHQPTIHQTPTHQPMIHQTPTHAMTLETCHLEGSDMLSLDPLSSFDGVSLKSLPHVNAATGNPAGQLNSRIKSVSASTPCYKAPASPPNNMTPLGAFSFSESCVSPMPPAAPPSSAAPSQEILTHYYTENVRLRDKVTSLRRERSHLAEQLAGCRLALEDARREREMWISRVDTSPANKTNNSTIASAKEAIL